MKVSLKQKKLQNSSKQQNKKVRNILTSAFSILLLFFFTFTTYAQNNILVKGRITNENGEPMPRASIVVKGGATGVGSNDNGDFEINAPANGTLVVSSVGFGTKEIDIRGQQSISITLSISANSLDQVVVVGYGTQKKKDVTGSVTSERGCIKRSACVKFAGSVAGACCRFGSSNCWYNSRCRRTDPYPRNKIRSEE